MASPLVVPHRFRGPSSSGNGGWTAGALAQYLPGAPAVTVRLSAPPPLEVEMDVEVALLDGGGGRRCATARVGDRLIVTATEVDDTIATLPPVDLADALQAQERYPGGSEHPFPECFACGPGRSVGDALVLRPGPAAGGDRGTVATTWLPTPEQADGGGSVVTAPIAWAALDCPGGWSVDLAGRPMVLGTMTAALGRLPRVGEACVIVGHCVEHRGRKAETLSTLRGADGEVLGRARAVWIEVDPASVRPAAANLS